MQEVAGLGIIRCSRSWLLLFGVTAVVVCALHAAPARAEPLVAVRAPSGSPTNNDAALAARFAPVVYFDQRVPGDHGKRSKCLPQSAEPYYEAHIRGDQRRICNQDARTLNDAPAYYEVAHINDSTFITYWFFYGYQGTCSTGFGSHDSDWERVAVRIAQGRLRDVVYWQHNGRYTRRAEHVRREGDHPVVYSGKNSHGSYHDTGGSGGCRYFADYRNPGGRKLEWQTQWHLESLAAHGEA
ncbi:MAG TPA: Vps62-related protein, partial [Polyangia bacterium]|nr:Vps62-related protein [Polyangia bacterium]